MQTLYSQTLIVLWKCKAFCSKTLGVPKDIQTFSSEALLASGTNKRIIESKMGRNGSLWNNPPGISNNVIFLKRKTWLLQTNVQWMRDHQMFSKSRLGIATPLQFWYNINFFWDPLKFCRDECFTEILPRWVGAGRPTASHFDNLWPLLVVITVVLDSVQTTGGRPPR